MGANTAENTNLRLKAVLDVLAEEVWTGEKYVSLRKKLVEEQLFPVCRRCCKVELAPEPAGAANALPADPELAALGAP